jgi:hypothetical protein
VRLNRFYFYSANISRPFNFSVRLLDSSNRDYFTPTHVIFSTTKLFNREAMCRNCPGISHTRQNRYFCHNCVFLTCTLLIEFSTATTFCFAFNKGSSHALLKRRKVMFSLTNIISYLSHIRLCVRLHSMYTTLFVNLKSS